ncbi:MAG: D-alanine--D-alanine ligase [Deltaproteobacteria bacterium]|nr:D-alanine--D-alanine ligase [Deltaproteobacteria bacterium]
MRIGLTYDMREEYLALGYTEEEVVELDKPETIEGLEAALAALGHQPVRIGNHRALAAALLAGERWDLVFNIAEGMHGLGRESLVPAMLDAWKIPYTFSDPMVLAISLHKGMCKRVVQQLGVPTAPFAVLDRSEDAAGLALPFPLFLKPVAEGTGKGIDDRSVVRDPEALAAVSADLLARFEQQVLVETFLPGREFTVGIVGTGAKARIAGVMEVHIPGDEDAVYSMETKENYVGVVHYGLLEAGPLREDVEGVALAAWRGLGCRDGGRVDVRLDAAGRANFIEVNPLAGLNHVHSDLPIMTYMAGGDFTDLIGAIVASALERTDARRSSSR